MVSAPPHASAAGMIRTTFVEAKPIPSNCNEHISVSVHAVSA
jgi:hypothetical protein